MCGVFGFVAKKDHEPDLAQLERIAKTTMRRGPHAFGFAWIDRKGRLKMFKQEGRIVDHVGLLNMARDARMLIGHCRYATQGDPANNLNNHPHPVDGGWFVHNGVIRDYHDLIRRHGLFPVSDCDSEVLGLLVERSEGSLVERSRLAVTSTERAPLVTLAIWNRPRRLIAVRRGNPLHIGRDRTGFYLGSLKDDLPGDVTRVEDGSILEFTRGCVEQLPLQEAGLEESERFELLG